MGELIKLEASHGRRYIVEPGVLDDRALMAFTMGHCHSMGLALQARLGGEIVGLVGAQRSYDHILVALDEDTFVDVGGARSKQAVVANGGKLVPLSRAELDELVANGWMPVRPDVAATFVPAIVACVGAGETHRSPCCYSRDFVLGDALEVHLEWSTADTGERLTAFGRPVDERSGCWTRCAVMSITEDQNGERIIDFTPEAFSEHADRFTAALQSKLGHLLANVAAAKNPEQPRRPPPA